MQPAWSEARGVSFTVVAGPFAGRAPLKGRHNKLRDPDT